MTCKLWADRGIRIVIHGPDGDQHWTTDRPCVSVGSDASCDLVIPHLSVQKATYLHATRDGVYHCPLSNGLPSAGWLKREDSLRLDRGHSLSIELESGDDGIATCVDLQSPRVDAGQRAPILEVRLKSRFVGRIQLHRRLTVLGQHRPAAVRLNSPHISPCHCVLYREGQRVWVVDLTCGKSTCSEGKPSDVAEVDLGQHLILGKLKLSYVGLSTIVSGRREEVASASRNGNHYNRRTHQSEVALSRQRPMGRVESAGDGKGVLMAEGNRESSHIEQEVARCLAEGHEALAQLANAREHLRLDFRADGNSDADGSIGRIEPSRAKASGGNRVKHFDPREELEGQRRELRHLGQAFAKLDRARRSDYFNLAKRLDDLLSSSHQRNVAAAPSVEKNEEAMQSAIDGFRQKLSAELDEVYRIVELRFQERDSELQRRLERLEAAPGPDRPLGQAAEESAIALPPRPTAASRSPDVRVESSELIGDEDSVSQAKQQAEQLSLKVCDRLVEREQQSNRRSRLIVAASIGLIGVVMYGAYLLLEWVKTTSLFF